MSEPLKQVVNENYSDLPYHNKQTEAIQYERAHPKPLEAPKPVEVPKPEAPKV